MYVPQKCEYALRALFELARHYGEGPIKIAQIAEVQAIPQSFLEVILSQLKKSGFVDSQRGNEGGYYMVRAPNELTVGDVIRFMQGSVGPVACVAHKDNGNSNSCPLSGGCVLLPMWEEVQKAISHVYDGTTFQTLVDEDKRMRSRYVPDYAI